MNTSTTIYFNKLVLSLLEIAFIIDALSVFNRILEDGVASFIESTFKEKLKGF